VPSRVRKCALTVHVVASVGWLGAVAAFLALAIAGRTSDDADIVSGSYIATELITWSVIVPLCGASLVTGVVQGLGTTWGLFRHYWVVTKLVLTVVATVVLALQIEPIAHAADLATQSRPGDELRVQGSSLVLHASGGILVLLTTATLSIYKPRGRTRYGWRKQLETGGRALP
jgi:hypothetical protein